MKKVLVVEDDADLYNLLTYTLEREGFSTAGQRTGQGCIDLCRRVKPDLVLLDIMLPDDDGLHICKRIRSDRELAGTPIIFLTARGTETDRVVGLELGANDYIVKPFFMRELMARIKLQFRQEAPAPPPTLRAGTLELNLSTFQLTVSGKQTPLTATEFHLLEHFMSHPGVVFSRSQLLTSVWKQDHVTDRVVDVYILRLRQKVEPEPERPMYLHSIRGFGYSFDPARELVAEA
jgi:DNA-binding response OmpR family regulator